MSQIDDLLSIRNTDPKSFNYGRIKMLQTFRDVMINIALVDQGIFPAINKYISEMTDEEQSDYLFELEALAISGMSFSEFVSLIRNR